MRFKLFIALAFFFFFGCARSEKLDDDEMHYVQTTLALTKARVESRDSVQLIHKLDSVYKAFGTSKDGYKKQTMGFSNDPERAQIIFRAIGDSMNLK
jgi:hypothetical protein